MSAKDMQCAIFTAGLDWFGDCHSLNLKVLGLLWGDGTKDSKAHAGTFREAVLKLEVVSFSQFPMQCSLWLPTFSGVHRCCGFVKPAFSKATQASQFEIVRGKKLGLKRKGTTS